jgi:putative transposase
MNAICECVIETLRREPPDRTLIFSERHLDLVLREYIKYYDAHSLHQSRQQQPRTLKPSPSGTWPTRGLSAENPVLPPKFGCRV